MASKAKPKRSQDNGGDLESSLEDGSDKPRAKREKGNIIGVQDTAVQDTSVQERTVKRRAGSPLSKELSVLAEEPRASGDSRSRSSTESECGGSSDEYSDSSDESSSSSDESSSSSDECSRSSDESSGSGSDVTRGSPDSVSSPEAECRPVASARTIFGINCPEWFRSKTIAKNKDVPPIMKAKERRRDGKAREEAKSQSTVESIPKKHAAQDASLRQGEKCKVKGGAPTPRTWKKKYNEEAAARAAAKSKKEEYKHQLDETFAEHLARVGKTEAKRLAKQSEAEAKGLAKQGRSGIVTVGEKVVVPAREKTTPDVHATSFQNRVSKHNRKDGLRRQQTHDMKGSLVSSSSPIATSTKVATGVANATDEYGTKRSGRNNADVDGGPKETTSEDSTAVGAGTAVTDGTQQQQQRKKLPAALPPKEPSGENMDSARSLPLASLPSLDLSQATSGGEEGTELMHAGGISPLEIDTRTGSPPTSPTTSAFAPAPKGETEKTPISSPPSSLVVFYDAFSDSADQSERGRVAISKSELSPENVKGCSHKEHPLPDILGGHCHNEKPPFDTLRGCNDGEASREVADSNDLSNNEMVDSTEDDNEQPSPGTMGGRSDTETPLPDTFSDSKLPLPETLDGCNDGGASKEVTDSNDPSSNEMIHITEEDSAQPSAETIGGPSDTEKPMPDTLEEYSDNKHPLPETLEGCNDGGASKEVADSTDQTSGGMVAKAEDDNSQPSPDTLGGGNDDERPLANTFEGCSDNKQPSVDILEGCNDGGTSQELADSNGKSNGGKVVIPEASNNQPSPGTLGDGNDDEQLPPDTLGVYDSNEKPSIHTLEGCNDGGASKEVAVSNDQSNSGTVVAAEDDNKQPSPEAMGGVNNTEKPFPDALEGCSDNQQPLPETLGGCHDGGASKDVADSSNQSNRVVVAVAENDNENPSPDTLGGRSDDLVILGAGSDKPGTFGGCSDNKQPVTGILGGCSDKEKQPLPGTLGGYSNNGEPPPEILGSCSDKVQPSHNSCSETQQQQPPDTLGSCKDKEKPLPETLESCDFEQPLPGIVGGCCDNEQASTDILGGDNDNKQPSPDTLGGGDDDKQPLLDILGGCSGIKQPPPDLLGDCKDSKEVADSNDHSNSGVVAIAEDDGETQSPRTLGHCGENEQPLPDTLGSGDDDGQPSPDILVACMDKPDALGNFIDNERARGFVARTPVVQSSPGTSGNFSDNKVPSLDSLGGGDDDEQPPSYTLEGDSGKDQPPPNILGGCNDINQPSPGALEGCIDNERPSPETMVGGSDNVQPSPDILGSSSDKEQPSPDTVESRTDAKQPSPETLGVCDDNTPPSPDTLANEQQPPDILEDCSDDVQPPPNILRGCSNNSQPLPETLGGDRDDEQLSPDILGGCGDNERSSLETLGSCRDNEQPSPDALGGYGNNERPPPPPPGTLRPVALEGFTNSGLSSPSCSGGASDGWTEEEVDVCGSVGLPVERTIDCGGEVDVSGSSSEVGDVFATSPVGGAFVEGTPDDVYCVSDSECEEESARVGDSVGGGNGERGGEGGSKSDSNSDTVSDIVNDGNNGRVSESDIVNDGNNGCVSEGDIVNDSMRAAVSETKRVSEIDMDSDRESESKSNTVARGNHDTAGGSRRDMTWESSSDSGSGTDERVIMRRAWGFMRALESATGNEGIPTMEVDMGSGRVVMDEEAFINLHGTEERVGVILASLARCALGEGPTSVKINCERVECSWT